MAYLGGHRKEYRQQLFRTPAFWIGLVVFILAIVLRLTELIGGLIFTILFVIGFIFMITSKYRIIGRLEQKYR